MRDDMTPQQLDPAFIACRAQGHLWIHRDDYDHHGRRDLPTFTRRDQCDRCGAERKRVIDLSRGVVSPRGMTYPPGYRAPGLSKAQVLAAML